MRIKEDLLPGAFRALLAMELKKAACASSFRPEAQRFDGVCLAHAARFPAANHTGARENEIKKRDHALDGVRSSVRAARAKKNRHECRLFFPGGGILTECSRACQLQADCRLQ